MLNFLWVNVDIKIEKSEIFINPDRYKDLFSALLHVFRNAIDHGIESREERISKNKNGWKNNDCLLTNREDDKNLTKQN